ncbi:hypothetical protein [Phenylobacterium zucineum]|uniref:hypothetical protein n=1 Tax=Phenylobacterium zucineum TaxID=284016 RepID=UPI0002DE3A1A|nr:hypothetical protein [Phenylobacterium zucineum]
MPHKQTEEEAKRAFTHGSSGATADMATDRSGSAREQGCSDEPHARRADETLREGEKPDQIAQRKAEDRQEALLDEAIEETFPGSDPISPKHIT